MAWRLEVRASHEVERRHFDALDDALAAFDARWQELTASAAHATVDVKIRQFEPAEQVVARLELAGPERLVPSVRVGIDVRGDGSSEAFRGRIRRTALDPRSGEDAFATLRRSLADVIAAAGKAAESSS